MNIEIERKFLVKKDLLELNTAPVKIRQGFLSDDPERSVRIRIFDDKAYITIKGKSDDSGTSRPEYEFEIDINEAEKLLTLCKGHIIEKLRYHVEAGAHLYEVDVFKGKNNGLIIAEIEMNDLHESIAIPEWLAEEITGDFKYYNLNLSKHPYSSWINI